MVVCLLVTGSAALAGTVVVSTAAPSDAIASDAVGATSYTKIFDYDANTNHVRGNTFVTDDNPTGDGWMMASLTIRKQNTSEGLQTFNNDTLKVWIAEGTADMWILGDGEGDSDMFNGTGMTVLVEEEAFVLSGAIADDSYINLVFDTPVYLDENTTYVWVATYERSDDATSPRCIEIVENGLNTVTEQIRINATENSTRGGYAMTYYVQPLSRVATNPLPNDEAPSVNQDTNLTWDNPLGYPADHFELYIRADAGVNEPNWVGAGTYSVDPVADLDLDGDPATTEADPEDTGITIEPDTTYYWKVVSHEPNTVGTIAYESSTWSFTTAPIDPTFLNDAPVSVTVAPGTDASLTIEAINHTTTTWYQSDDTVVGGDTEAGTGDTLVLTDVQQADEGWYYAVISNGITAVDQTSQMARLMTRRMVAYWDFEDSSVDSEEGFIGVIDDPNFAAGGSFNGSDACELSTKDDMAIVIADSNDYFNFYPQGLTVNLWVNTMGSNPYQSPIGKTQGDSTGFCIISTLGDKVYSGSRLAGITTSAEAFLNNLQWRMVTLTYDPSLESGNLAYYVDGEYANSTDITTAPATNSAPLVIGKSDVAGVSDNYFEGMIDEVKIYSFGFSETDVLGLYNEYADVPKELCILDYAAHLDIANAETDLTIEDEGFEPDCVIDMSDLAALADNWLSDGRTSGTISE